MADGQLLIPATQAALRLGISRRTLRRHIGAGLVRSVTVRARTYIPQGEIERIVNGEPVQISAPKPQTHNGISSNGTNEHTCGQDTELTPDDRFEALFNGHNWRQGFEEGVSGDSGGCRSVFRACRSPVPG